MQFKFFYPRNHENYEDIVRTNYSEWDANTDPITDIAFIFWEKDSFLYYPKIDLQNFYFLCPNIHLFYGNEFHIQDHNLTIKVIARNRKGINSIMRLVNTSVSKGEILLDDVLRETKNLYVFLENNMEDKDFFDKNRRDFSRLRYLDNFRYEVIDGEVKVIDNNWFDKLQKIIPFSPFKVEVFGKYPRELLRKNVDEQIKKVDAWYFSDEPGNEIEKRRLNYEYDYITNTNFTDQFLAGIKVVQKYSDLEIPVSLRGTFASCSIITFIHQSDFEFNKVSVICDNCSLSTIEQFCPRCGEKVNDDILGESDFDLSFDKKVPYLQINYPDNFQDMEDFLNDCFQDDGLIATKLESNGSPLVKFVLTPYNVILPLNEDLMCPYSISEIGCYFPIIGLQTNNFISKFYRDEDHYLDKLDIQSIDADMIYYDLNRTAGGINLQRLADVANRFNVKLDKRKTLLKILGIALFKAKYTDKDKNLDDVITNREELFEKLKEKGVTETRARFLVRDFIDEDYAKSEIKDVLPDFDTNTYLYPIATIYEALKIIYNDLDFQDYIDRPELYDRDDKILDQPTDDEQNSNED